MASDGQVTFGQTVMKQGAKKIRRLYGAEAHPYNPQVAEPSPLLALPRAARL
jgi:hypothetical protein